MSDPPLAMPPGLSPDDLDSITELANLISRLPSTPPNGTTGQTPAAAPTPASSSQQQQQQQNLNGPLSLKEIPLAADHLKHKLQRARAAIKALPDMDKTVADQEQEMRELEDRIRRQREQLQMLKDKGLEFAAQRE